MNPKAIDAAQTTHDSLPTVAATAPIENSTSGGTPLATQNAPVQSMPRSSPVTLTGTTPAVSSAVMLTYQHLLQQHPLQQSNSYVSLFNIIGRGRCDPVRPCTKCTTRIKTSGVTPPQFQRCRPRCHMSRP